jgi:hypothetical protein
MKREQKLKMKCLAMLPATTRLKFVEEEAKMLAK